MVTQTIGSVTFSLREDFDFTFLRAYGEPFAVFDEQDSGNLCFGMRRDGRRLFVKSAGMRTKRGPDDPGIAVSRLRDSVSIYRELEHPALAALISHGPIDGGYAAVFEWADGLCMGRQYGNGERFAALPLSERLRIYDVILRFHLHVHQKGYVAIDFYDGCVLYDFSARRTTLCDIELYRRKPVRNDMGRMWGSSRYMSPEEFKLGAAIDEQSNVFAMGAAAFQLFGGDRDRSKEAWRAPEPLFAVAVRAAEAERTRRYPSIAALTDAWDAAVRSAAD